MQYIVDIALLVIILISAFWGAKKGFVQTIIALVGSIASLIAAIFFSKPAAQYAYENFIAPSVVKQVEGIISSSDQVAGLQGLLDQLKTAVPPGVSNGLGDIFNMDFEALLNFDLTNVIDAASLVDQAFMPVILPIITFTAFICIFSVLKIVTQMIIKAISLITKLPVIEKANKILGFASGAFIGLINAFVFYFGLWITVGFSGGAGFITTAMMKSCVIYPIFNYVTTLIQ